MNKCDTLISDTGSTALKAARLLQDEYEKKNVPRPLHLRCTLHISGGMESYGYDELSPETRSFSTHVMMVLGKRQNVKFQRNFAGNHYKHFCDSNQLIKMKINSLYGSRWTIHSRNAGNGPKRLICGDQFIFYFGFTLSATFREYPGASFMKKKTNNL